MGELEKFFGWDLDFVNLSGGRSPIPVRMLVSENITVFDIRFHDRIHQRGLPPSEVLTFGLPIHGIKDWFGKPMDSGILLPFNQPNGIDSVNRAGFFGQIICVKKDFLKQVAAVTQTPAPNSLWRPTTGSHFPSSIQLHQIQEMLMHSLQSGEWVDKGDDEAELVVSLLKAARSGAQPADRITRCAKTRSMKKALEYIECHARDAPSVSEICTEMGIAWRTMDRAFKERFDMGPKAYILRYRLNKVREKLESNRPQRSVGDAANAWGFWHMGQFARDYRKLFGELPSTTIHRV